MPLSKKLSVARSKVKIPDFDRFRKRLFLGISGGVLLVALLIWMFVFAPAATVIVTAGTSPAAVSAAVKLGGTAATDYKTGIVSSVSQQEKKDETIEFEATGQKDIGDKATGTVRFSTVLITSLGTIPAGTRLTSTSGKVFTTDRAVTLNNSNYTGVEVDMTAVDPGTSFNGASGQMSGAPSGVNATIVGTTSGGTTNVTKVVSADDVERAKGQLIGQSTDTAKKDLAKKFADGEKVIDSSFTVDRADAVSAPAIDAAAPDNGRAKLTIATTYTLYAVPEAALKAYLDDSIKAQLDNEDAQRVYDNGLKEATLSNFRKDGDTLTATVVATGQIGPKLEDAQIKEAVKGKIYGEAQSSLEAIDGIEEVDVKFSYFWVRRIPGDINKIQVQFDLKDE